MPRRLSLSQIRSKIRRSKSKHRQVVQKWNSEVRAYNRKAVSYNARLRANRSRLNSALQSFATQTITLRYSSLHRSMGSLYSAYERLDNSDADPVLSDLAERDTANSVTVLNTLLKDGSDVPVRGGELTRTKLWESLTGYSRDVRDRWSGAMFSLNPQNPDAARHFCASAREILADIINDEAPDAEVLHRFPGCEVTDLGTPTRRTKIHYCLDRKGMNNGPLEDFIEVNINDLSVLFRDLNAGTHGPAGRYSLPQLTAIKTRVEDAIDFMCEIAR